MSVSLQKLHFCKDHVPIVLSPLAFVWALISQLFIRSSLVHPENCVCLEHIVPYQATAGLSLSKRPWSLEGWGSQPATPLTEPVNDELLAYDRTELFHIPAFDAFWTSAERHGVFRHGVEGTLQAREQTEKAVWLFNKLKEGKSYPRPLGKSWKWHSFFWNLFPCFVSPLQKRC